MYNQVHGSILHPQGLEKSKIDRHSKDNLNQNPNERLVNLGIESVLTCIIFGSIPICPKCAFCLLVHAYCFIEGNVNGNSGKGYRTAKILFRQTINNAS